MSTKKLHAKILTAPVEKSIVPASPSPESMPDAVPPTLDILNEQVVTFIELARRLPCRRDGRPTHVETIRRWRVRGLKGVKLAAFRCGGTWATTLEAYQRFCESLTRLPV